eukprot:5358851-Pleurochrysis_carterae.AAC.2
MFPLCNAHSAPSNSVSRQSRLASHGEVRHPLISSVLYLGDEESLAEAPPTVVSTQRVGRRTTSASAPPKASSSSSSSSLALATAQEAAEVRMTSRRLRRKL